MCPVHKKGDPTMTFNYRTLLEVVYKILTSIFYRSWWFKNAPDNTSAVSCKTIDPREAWGNLSRPSSIFVRRMAQSIVTMGSAKPSWCVEEEICQHHKNMLLGYILPCTSISSDHWWSFYCISFHILFLQLKRWWMLMYREFAVFTDHKPVENLKVKARPEIQWLDEWWQD